MHVRIRLVPPSRKRGPAADRIPGLSRGGLAKHFARFRLWEPAGIGAPKLKLRLARASPRD